MAKCLLWDSTSRVQGNNLGNAFDDLASKQTFHAVFLRRTLTQNPFKQWFIQSPLDINIAIKTEKSNYWWLEKYS